MMNDHDYDDSFAAFAEAYAKPRRAGGTMTAAVYARVSTEEQTREGYSLDEQVRPGRERAAADGLGVADEHVYGGRRHLRREGRPARVPGDARQRRSRRV